MTTALNKTVRLPAHVVRAANTRAAELGLTFTDVVEVALRDHLGLGGNAAFDVLEQVRDHLMAAYPDRQGFPRDVTLDVFKHLRAEPTLWALYTDAIRGADGELATAARDSLHRRIGRAVKVVLNATVIGRSQPLDPEVELICSHALLEPTDV